MFFKINTDPSITHSMNYARAKEPSAKQIKQGASQEGSKDTVESIYEQTYQKHMFTGSPYMIWATLVTQPVNA